MKGEAQALSPIYLYLHIHARPSDNYAAYSTSIYSLLMMTMAQGNVVFLLY